MKVHGEVDARVHILAAMALERGRMTSPMLVHLLPPGKALVLILQEIEWTPASVWT